MPTRPSQTLRFAAKSHQKKRNWRKSEGFVAFVLFILGAILGAVAWPASGRPLAVDIYMAGCVMMQRHRGISWRMSGPRSPSVALDASSTRRRSGGWQSGVLLNGEPCRRRRV